MEDDRVLVDLGIAAELEEIHISQNAVKQPKRRFVGRRAATEAAANSTPGQSSASIEDAGAIQGIFSYRSCLPRPLGLMMFSCPAEESAEDVEPGATRDSQ